MPAQLLSLVHHFLLFSFFFFTQASRISFSSTRVSTANDSEELDPLSTVQDLIYLGNISVGSQEFLVQLDTGSSDIWIQTPNPAALSNINETDYPVNLTYGVGFAFGYLSFATVEFAGTTAPDQALLLVGPDNASNPALSYDAAGIVGLGFKSLSSLANPATEVGMSGNSLLPNIFETNSIPSIMSLSFQDSEDPESTVVGTLGIGEIDPVYENVTSSPNISTFPANSPSRWTIAINGILFGNTTIPLSSNVTGAPGGASIGLLDSGTSFIYVQPSIATALYGNIDGASSDPSSGIWTVPCGAEVDVAIVIENVLYPMAPLDVVPPSLADPTLCQGAFIGQQVAFGGFDMLLGLGFLRSVYSVFNFGAEPSVQLLSLVDPVRASIDFVNVRGGTALTESPYPMNAANTSSSTSTSSSGSSSTNAEDVSIPSSVVDNLNKITGYIPAMLAILALNAAVLLVLCIVGIVILVRRGGKGRRGKKGLTAMPLGRRGSRPPSPYPHVYEPVDTQGTDDAPFAPPQPMDVDDTQFTPPMPAFHADVATPRPVAPGLRPHSMMTTSSMGGVPRAYRASAASDATAFMPPSPGFLQAEDGKWVSENRPKSIA